MNFSPFKRLLTPFKRLLWTLILVPLGLLVALPASAEAEYWQAVDVQIPLDNPSQTWLYPDAFRAFTIAQLAPRFEGLGVLRFSVGPVWQLTPGLSLGIFGDVLALQAPAGNPTQEFRLNLEPLAKGRMGDDFGWVERVRLEYRHLPAFQSWRVRNLARINWFWSEDWLAFVSDEVFFEFPGGFNQNRAMIGIGQQVAPGTRLELAYQARSRKGANEHWDLDHILVLFLFFAPG
ncbi:MAG: hypothetical protein CVV27_06735 [Candidatus Melainabacteria bacterium HGW-Melainabacteria-1]|nr:MAG: hypothetical protein CVV27_06735 [Candidatus Melainabacteria bacterium HGW-Melainabacteria-1]